MVATASDIEHQVRGRILDLDGHVMFGPEVFDELLGPSHRAAMAAWLAPLAPGINDENRALARRRALDDVGSVRGFLALGADDAEDRLCALDLLGIARQLVLPPVAWPTLDDDQPTAAASRRRYNNWVSDWASGTDRLVPAAQLAMHDPAVAVADAEALVDMGFRAVELPFAAPPADRSPADASWDPLWLTLEEAGVAVILHLGGAGPGAAVPPPRQFLDTGWNRIAELAPVQFPRAMSTLRDNAMAGPVGLATLHIPAEVFLTSLILGGALARHPALRIVVLEMGAQWVSSWVERIDAIAGSYRTFGLEPMSERPVDMVRRQVRVTPFERNDIASWIEHDGLSEVYAFSSDFPHAEGGRDPVGRFARNLARLGPEASERFFIENAASVFASAAIP